MNFREYQDEAITTLIKNKNTPVELFARLILGLAGENGEIAEKAKKLLRGDCNMTFKFKNEIKKECGDLLWYLANLVDFLGLDLEEVAKENIDKLASRKKRGKIKGSGDLR